MSFFKGEKETSKEKERKYLQKEYGLQAEKKKKKKKRIEKEKGLFMLLDGSDKYLGAALVVKLAISAAKMAFIVISATDIVIVIMFHVKLGGAVR